MSESLTFTRFPLLSVEASDYYYLFFLSYASLFQAIALKIQNKKV